MKFAFLTGLLALLLVAGAAAQQAPPASDQNLPPAPSASIAPTPPAQPAPPEKPETSKAAPHPDNTQPALQDLPGSKKPDAPPPSSEPESQPASPDATAPPARQAKAAAENLTTDERGAPLETIRKQVNEVNVVFTVTDKHGHFVKNLTKDDFRVIDDNKPASSIDFFSSETNLPLRVGLLIDSSNSVRDRFRFEQESAIEFLNSIIRPKSDRAFVIGFDTTAEVTQDFTDNSQLLSRGVRMLRPGGGTAMYDAIYYACRDKLMHAPASSGPVRRAIILLSDGEDNQSRVTREEAVEMAQRAEVIIYTISTNVSGMKLRGDKVLERFADATGGRAFFPFKIQDVANAFAEIQDELRSQYLLAYKPADLKPDGHYRAIDIVAANHKSLRVRARKGYYAPTK